MLECVINVSEGRRSDVVTAVAAAAGDAILDLHSDPDHHRSVITVVGEETARRVAAVTVDTIDLAAHRGAHPRIGALDVVPFVPLAGTGLDDAIAARNRFAHWAARELELPCFLYGPERSLPEVRRGAFTTLRPDTGPDHPHPSAGATAVGARRVLVAYNLWLAEPDVALARRIAARLRGPTVQALGLAVAGGAQVSVNLLDPEHLGPAELHDRVAAMAPVARAELVGLMPAAALQRIDRRRWAELDLGEDRTIEARLERAGERAR